MTTIEDEAAECERMWNALEKDSKQHVDKIHMVQYLEKVGVPKTFAVKIFDRMDHSHSGDTINFKGFCR